MRRSWRMRMVVVVAVASGAVGGVGWWQAPTPARADHDPAGTYCAGPAEAEMLALINDFRAGRALDPLGLSRPLGAAATHKSQKMASQGYFRHTSLHDVTPRELVVAHGYEHNTVTGENLAAGQERADATFVQWRESDSHRELQLDEAFEAIGVARAYAVESEYDWYWTAEFGGVLAAPAEPCADAPTGTPIAPVAPAAPAVPGSPAPSGAVPVRLVCNGVQLPDGTYDLTCRPG